MNNPLNDEQKEALKLINAGYNIFLTGDAGTGKSFLLDYFIKNNSSSNILVCAPTGVAALNIGGTTIHRAFKLPLNPAINTYITSCPQVVKAADIIIIDEISMCRIDIFDYIMRTLNYKRLEFNKSTQVILVGDFFQLPPVVQKDELEVLKVNYPNFSDGYCFESKFWAEYNFKTIKLTQVMRQDEEEFKNNLNKARIGDTSCIPYFNQRVGKPVKDPIYLTAYNKDAARINEDRLEAIDKTPFTIDADIEGDVSSKDFPTDEHLTLKLGARIMCIINDPVEDKYVNGSLGTITGYDNDTIEVELDNGQEICLGKHLFEYYDYKVEDDIGPNGAKIKKLEKTVKGTFNQIPVKLAYAITIHKSQGQTYDSALIRPRTFAPGQLYVALSRCRSFENLSLDYAISYDYLRASTKVLKFYNILELSEEDKIELIDIAKNMLDYVFTERGNEEYKTLPEYYKAQLKMIYNIFRGGKNGN